MRRSTVDLSTLQVRSHPLALGARAADAVVGPTRHALWLGRGLLAVTGSDSSPSTGARPTLCSSSTHCSPPPFSSTPSARRPWERTHRLLGRRQAQVPHPWRGSHHRRAAAWYEGAGRPTKRDDAHRRPLGSRAAALPAFHDEPARRRCPVLLSRREDDRVEAQLPRTTARNGPRWVNRAARRRAIVRPLTSSMPHPHEWSTPPRLSRRANRSCDARARPAQVRLPQISCAARGVSLAVWVSGCLRPRGSVVVARGLRTAIRHASAVCRIASCRRRRDRRRAARSALGALGRSRRALMRPVGPARPRAWVRSTAARSEEHTSELQSHSDLVCRLLLEKKKKQ